MIRLIVAIYVASSVQLNINTLLCNLSKTSNWPQGKRLVQWKSAMLNAKIDRINAPGAIPISYKKNTCESREEANG